MNKQLKLGIVICLLLISIVVIARAEPPIPPVTARGFIFDSAGVQMPAGTNVTINNTNLASPVRNGFALTATSGPDASTTGFYQVDVNGTEGQIIDLVAFNQSEFGYNFTFTIANYTVRINTTINDSRVLEPTLLAPANNTIIVARAPIFAWNGSFDRVNETGMVRNYTLQISTNAAFTQIVANISDVNETNTINTTYALQLDLNLSTTFYWRVQAFQKNTSAYSRFSKTFNFTLVTAIACSLPTPVVDFGVLGLNKSNNTLNPPNNPQPFILKNTGNQVENISINASNLWNATSAQNPSIFYQWKITDNASNSFTAANTTTFLNISTVIEPTIENLGYNNATSTQPAARIELNITAYEKEPPGQKRSDVLVTCEG